MKRVLLLVLTLLNPAFVLAHEGHGEQGFGGLLHYLLEPVHWVWFLVLLLIVVGYQHAKRLCCRH